MTDYRSFSLADYDMNKQTAENIQKLIAEAVSAKVFNSEETDSLIRFSNHLWMKIGQLK